MGLFTKFIEDAKSGEHFKVILDKECEKFKLREESVTDIELLLADVRKERPHMSAHLFVKYTEVVHLLINSELKLSEYKSSRPVIQEILKKKRHEIQQPLIKRADEIRPLLLKYYSEFDESVKRHQKLPLDVSVHSRQSAKKIINKYFT